jgi:tetratricopeptide (TPR) repeat protein
MLVVSDVAQDESGLIPCLTGLTDELSEGIRERQTGVRQSRSKIMAVTPSFAAYQKIIEAEGMIDRFDLGAAIDLYADALKLDPECSYALMMTGFMYLNLRMVDSAFVALEKARQHPERLTEEQTMVLDAMTPTTGTIETANIAARERISILNPNDASNWWNLGVSYNFAGRVEETIEAAKKSMEVSPVGTQPTQWSGLALGLASAGHYEEARDIIENELDGALRTSSAVVLAAAEGDWDAQDSLASIMSNRPAMASARAARGEVRAAMQLLGQEPGPGSTLDVPGLLIGSAYLRLTSQTELKDSDEANLPESTAIELLAAGLDAVSIGNLPKAREHFHALEGRRDELQYEAEDLPPVLEAWIAAGENRWDSVITIARPVATRHRQEFSRASMAFAKPAARWLVATAYESKEQPDSAAFYYESALSHYRLFPDAVMLRGLGCSFARQRLVLVYASMGRLDDARKHWEIFSEAFTRPDPEVIHLVEEARAALASAEAMAAAEN